MLTRAAHHGGELLAQAVQRLYRTGQTDYSLDPLVRVDTSGRPVGRVDAGDAVIFCCRRGEREVELTEAFTENEFPYFARPELPGLNFVILTLYHEKFKDLPVAFAPVNIPGTLGEIVGQAGLSQMRCAESEKYAHVTFFLNGGNSQPFVGEVDVRVPSPTGIPFDRIPQLSLLEVADKVIAGIHAKTNLIVVNFANGDVIGHTTNPKAKIRCAEVVDHYLGTVISQAVDAGYAVAVTADHGNLEELLSEEGSPHVSHTSNPVPFLLIDPAASNPLKLKSGKLADIAPTLLEILGLQPSKLMTGASLVKGHHWGSDRRVLLIILDGWGLGRADDSNPIYLAHTPNWDQLIDQYPPVKLQAAGEAVGLKAGKTGNSEAGHMNIGAGRVVLQDDVRLDQSMAEGTFFTNEVFIAAMEGVKRRNTNLHLIGLLTEKSSHGSIDYPLALLKMARDRDVQDVFLHVIFDGRSTAPGSAPQLLDRLENCMSEIGLGQIVTGIGRGIALDRDRNYGKIKRAYDALVMGTGTAYPAQD